ncbi:MAG: ABC transporter permease subunit [Candidatus Synoicihabitans palmerolidicus]|nr:ABC transporter permease subunit [Candidatus Synoicihabitans palmerolidicus]
MPFLSAGKWPWRKIILPLVLDLIGLTLWQGLRLSGNLPRYKLPGFFEICAAAWSERSLIATAVIATGKAAAVGFLVAMICGFVISLILSSAAWIEEMVYPWVLFFQMIPVVILAPLFVLLLDQGLTNIVAITFMISFFPVVANTTHGVSSVYHGARDMFRLYQANSRQELMLLKVPFALPYFLTCVKIAATLAPMGAITGDLIAGSKSGDEMGIGFLVQLYKAQYDFPAVYACAGVSCVLGFCFVGRVYLLNGALLHRWHESFRRSE